MRRIFAAMLVASLILSGCMAKPTFPVPTSTEAPIVTTQATVPTEAAPVAAVKQAPMYAVNLPIITENETGSDGAVIFTHTYQNLSLTLPEPEIADKVILDFLNRSDTTQAAKDIKDAAITDHQSNEIPLYHCSLLYTPMRLDGSILSLLGTCSSFTGSIHPETVNRSVTYDLLTGSSLRCSAIFLETVTPEVLLPLILDALKEQSFMLYEGYEAMVAEKFNHGIDGNNDWYFSDEGLCFFFSPYEIGPYAIGTVIAQIPYGQLTDVLRDIYFPAERDATMGQIQVLPYEEANLDAYTQFAEVTIQSDTEKYLLITDSSIQDLRVLQNVSINPALSHAAAYTVFAAYGLTPGDAIVLETAQPVDLRYESGNSEITRIAP